MIKKWKGQKKLFKLLINKNGEELTQTSLKSEALLLACVFEKTIKVSFSDFDTNPLYCVSVPEFTWQWGLKHTGIN